MTKKCSKCGDEKQLSEFSKPYPSRYPDYYRPDCKACISARNKARYHDPDDHYADQCKGHMKKAVARGLYEEGGKYGLDYRLKNKYGISLEDYKSMLKAQGNSCAICEIPQSSQKRRFAVDHCHVSGSVRGLLCHSCNVLLGHAKDNPTILKNAITYLLES